MKLIAIKPGATTVELDPTDQLALADACRYAMHHNMPGDYSLMAAAATALESAALAAFALEPGMVEDGNYSLTTLREVWAPHDSAAVDGRRVVTPPVAEQAE